MNRVFQAKISTGSYLLLTLLLWVAIYSMWHVSGVLLCLSLLLLVVLIERMIHTTYTVTTDGMLVVCNGRFSKSQKVSLSDIEKIERVSGMRIGGKSVSSCLLLTCKNGKRLQLIPRNEEDFVKCISKRRALL